MKKEDKSMIKWQIHALLTGIYRDIYTIKRLAKAHHLMGTDSRILIEEISEVTNCLIKDIILICQPPLKTKKRSKKGSLKK